MAYTEHYVIDPFKGTVPLSALRSDAWSPEDDDGDDAPSFGVRKARRAVASLYRCIDIRAKAVSRMPFRLELLDGDDDVTEEPQYQPLRERLRGMRYLSEAALCTSASFYWELGRNRVGLNLTPFWLAPGSVAPIATPIDGLTGFRRMSGAGGRVFDRRLPGANDPPIFRDLCYGWLPSPDEEVAPDVAPARVALMAAQVEHGLDTAMVGFFRRGLVKAVLLTVEGNPPPAELKKLEAWWQRMIAGAGRAWRSVVVRSTVKPEVIGDGLKDLNSGAIRSDARENVAEAMGVPLSLIESRALAGGTAEAERLNFYEFTVEPQCQLIDRAFNDQYLRLLGLRMVSEPDKLPVKQAAKLAQAKAISEVVGKPVLTRDEGRALLGYGAWPEDEPDPPPPPVAPAPAPQAQDEEAPPAEPDEVEPDDEEEGEDEEQAARDDMKRWQRKALARLSAKGTALAPFESVHIPQARQQVIRAALEDATTPDAVRAAFRAARQTEVI